MSLRLTVKAALIRLLCTAFLFVWHSGAVIADESQELQQVKKQLKQIDKNLKGANSKRSKTLSSLEAIERDIAERTLRQTQTENKLAEIERESAKLIIRKDALNVEHKTALESVKTLLVATYKMGRQSGLKRLFSQQDPAQIGRFAQYAKYMANSQKALINKTKALTEELEGLESNLVSRRQQLDKLSRVLEKDQVYLSQLKNNRLDKIEELETQIADHSEKANTLKERERRLTSVLNELAKQRSNRLKQAKAQINVYSKHKEGKKTSQPKQPADIKLAARGSLPLPAKAKLAARFGQKRAESGIPWKGVLLRGVAGSEVRAIAAGEVVYTDWLTGYGQLIIIDHGNDLMSLYGHNRSLNKTVGDRVQQNDLIANMGDTAGLQSAALYFEIRHRGEPQDPLKWCKA